MASHTARSTLIVTVLDGVFNVLLAFCFLAIFGIHSPQHRAVVLELILVVYLLRTAVWLGARIRLLRPLDAWMKETANLELLRRAGKAIYNFPLVYTLFYCLLFIAMYGFVTWRVIAWGFVPPRAGLAGLLFALSIGVGSFATGFPLNLYMLAPTSRRISHPAQQRLNELPGISLSIRSKIVLLGLCLGLTPTLLMVAVQYMLGVRSDQRDVRDRSQVVASELAESYADKGRIALAAWRTTPGVTVFVASRDASPGAIPSSVSTPVRRWIRGLIISNTLGTTPNRTFETVVTLQRTSGGNIAGCLVSSHLHGSGTFIYAILLTALMSGAWAVLSALLMGSTVADPVARIASVVSKVSETREVDRELRAPVIYKDEVGTLAVGTNRMLDSLASHLAELESKNRELARAYRIKGQFLANMSHELRTPLNAIIGFSRLMLRKAKNKLGEREYKNLGLIHQSGQQLLALVNDILDFERIEAGRLKIAPSEVDCVELAAHLQQTLVQSATDKGLTLEVKVIDPPMRLWIDPDRLRQILVNFITNAIKYSDHGHVEARFERRDDTICIAVKDNGIGIPAEQLDKIFDPFHQVDFTDTRERGGAGLGLAIVYKLATLMGGTVDVQSSLDQGSTFTLVLPANTLMGASEAHGIDSLAPRGEGLEVLVIDDQVQFLEMMYSELTEAGFRVHLARSGEEGLAKIRQVKPSAVLLDIVMPGMGGWDVLSELRRHPETAQTPVIITSVLDDAPRGYDLGIAAWLTKPVDVGEFRRVIEGLDSSRGREVLVVEDDEATSNLIEEELEGLDLVVTVVGDGSEALQRLKQAMPAAVILDLGLPKVDGFTVLEELRDLPGGEEVPVIIYTARDLSDQDRERLGRAFVEVVRKHGTDSPTQVLRALRRRGLMK